MKKIMKNIFEKYNKKHENTFDVDLKTVDHWIKASELTKHEGLTLNVIAIGKHNSKYGDSGFIVGAINGGKTIGVNVPKWYIETIDEMVADNEVVGAIKSGGVVVKLGKRISKRDGNEYPTFEWDEIPLPY